MNNRKIVFISFADARYRKALDRIKEYTKKFPFDERNFLTEKNLPREFLKELKPWLYRRGYGYWKWKPFLVCSFLKRMNDGDILCYSDCGVYWNSTEEALNRFNLYINLLDTTPKDILVFEEKYEEQIYTKGDLLKALNVYDNDKICKSPQIWGGCFIIKNSLTARRIFSQYLELCDYSKELVTDKKSTTPNKEGFVEHRHDQSIFSLLVKTNAHITIPTNEIQPINNDNWDSLKNYPIQARRLKEVGRPFTTKMYNKLLRPWRILLNLYFRKIRNYYFINKSYPW